jgi:hypothetical protein
MTEESLSRLRKLRKRATAIHQTSTTLLTFVSAEIDQHEQQDRRDKPAFSTQRAAAHRTPKPVDEEIVNKQLQSLYSEVIELKETLEEFFAQPGVGGGDTTLPRPLAAVKPEQTQSVGNKDAPTSHAIIPVPSKEQAVLSNNGVHNHSQLLPVSSNAPSRFTCQLKDLGENMTNIILSARNNLGPDSVDTRGYLVLNVDT